MLRTIVFVLLLSHSAHAIQTPQIQLDVEKYQLGNGLTVLLHVDRSVPVVSYHTFFKVGSRDEEPGYTGLAHLFEHMMFKGAKRYKNSDFDRLLRANGASYNAWTTFDLTGYYIDLPSDKLELAIDLESDRMESLQVNEENLTSEREVVKEERRFRYDNNVRGTLWENTITQLYSKSNYRWPVIGYMEDLTRADVSKCRDFFRQYYAPNNAIIIVSGDFAPAKAKALIEKYYGHIKKQNIKRPEGLSEPQLSEQKIKIVEKDVSAELFTLSFVSTKVGHEDSYALGLLSDILGEGTSSRLYGKLVREAQFVDSISASNQGLREAGAFTIWVSMKNDAGEFERRSTLRLIEGELWRVRNRMVTARELERAKTRVMKAVVEGLKRINNRGSMLGHAELYYGDYRRGLEDLERFNAVTAEQIKAVANKYLDIKKSSLVVIAKGKKEKIAIHKVEEHQ